MVKKNHANGRPKDWDAARVAIIGRNLQQLIDELTMIFPERRHLIQQIVRALLVREHVIIFGVYGTGKSDLVHTLFGCITGATTFSIGLSKFMTEGNLVGIPDPKQMREEGKVVYRRDGGILDYDFAELDELFDSAPPLLRVLLGILNERQFKRGRQIESANLHTAIATTNGDPEEELRQHPELGAVIDRFLFLSQVRYLVEPESQRRMLEKYLGGETPTVQISLEDIKYMSAIVTGANQISDPEFVAVYNEVIAAYEKATNRKISDRRRCQLLQLIEAEALLHGRFEVDYEDIEAIRWGLCQGGNDAQHETFKATVLPIVKKAQEAKQQTLDQVQLKLLEQLATRVPVIPADCPKGQLVDLAREIAALAEEVKQAKPQLASTADIQHQLLARIAAVGDTVHQLIIPPQSPPKPAAPKRTPRT